jgi:hypothetical protein
MGALDYLNTGAGWGRAGRPPPPTASSPQEDAMARDKKSGPERIAEAVDVLRQWQGIERDAIETTAQIMEKTDNLLIRQIM